MVNRETSEHYSGKGKGKGSSFNLPCSGGTTGPGRVKCAACVWIDLKQGLLKASCSTAEGSLLQ